MTNTALNRALDRTVPTIEAKEAVEQLKRVLYLAGRSSGRLSDDDLADFELYLSIVDAYVRGKHETQKAHNGALNQLTLVRGRA